MKTTLKSFLLSLCVVAGFGLSAGAHAAAAKAAKADTSDKDEVRQTTPDTSPKAAYQRKVREIRSAHRDNLANCKSMSGSERSACVKEANQILKSDLADAKSGSTSSTGASGSTGTGESSGSSGPSSYSGTKNPQK